MKRILALLLIVSMTLSLAGCTNPDTELYKALGKMEEVTSLESETQIDFQIKGEGFEGSKQLEMEQLSTNLNNLKIGLKQKNIGNKEQTKAQSEGEFNIEFSGMIIATKVWTDIDLNNSDMKSIIQLPLLFKGLLGPEGANKEYLVYDIGKVMKLENEDFDFEGVMDLQKEFQPKIIELTKEIQKDLKPDFKILDLKEERQVNGEKIKLYQLKLDDETLKELIKEFINSALENDGTKELIVDYINQYMDTMINMGLDEELSKEEKEEINEELKEVEENLDKNLEKAKEELNKLMEEFKDITILGKEGISIEYFINKDGYVIETNGVIDLSLNLEEIAKLTEEIPEAKGILNLKISYNTKNTNINNKDLKIEFPTINEENSIDFLEIMEMQTQMPMLMP